MRRNVGDIGWAGRGTPGSYANTLVWWGKRGVTFLVEPRSHKVTERVGISISSVQCAVCCAGMVALAVMQALHHHNGYAYHCLYYYDPVSPLPQLLFGRAFK